MVPARKILTPHLLLALLFLAPTAAGAQTRDVAGAKDFPGIGRIPRIAYRTNPGPSILEVSRNFETQLTKAGFETLLACDTDACGGIPFTEAVDALPIPQMWVDGFNYHYFAGRKVDGGRETYASVVVSENNKEIYAQLIVAELGAIE